MLAFTDEQIADLAAKGLKPPKSDRPWHQVQASVAIGSTPENSWFVLKTEPQRETLAASHLVGHRFRCYLPTFQKMRKFGRGQQRAVSHPLFPTYLFVAWDTEGRHWGRVFSLPGVAGLLLTGDRPAMITADKIGLIHKEEERLAKRGIVRKVHEYAIGETVEVIKPLFEGLRAEIEKLADDERITLLLDFLGQKSRVTLKVSEIAKL